VVELCKLTEAAMKKLCAGRGSTGRSGGDGELPFTGGAVLRMVSKAVR
jgi:hypothetical protein